MMLRLAAFTPLALIAIISLSTTAFAQQQPPGFDPAQMQEMMKQFGDPAALQKLQQQAEAAAQCMENIDEKKLEAIRDRTEVAAKEIDRLCEQGKTDEALRKGMGLSQELRSDPTVKKLGVCAKDLGDMMKNMPWAQMSGIEDLQSNETPTRETICD
ncbi:MAG: hypothetical protein AB8G23_15940 [Myxococcota bacterium]